MASPGFKHHHHPHKPPQQSPNQTIPLTAASARRAVPLATSSPNNRSDGPQTQQDKSPGSSQNGSGNRHQCFRSPPSTILDKAKPEHRAANEHMQRRYLRDASAPHMRDNTLPVPSEPAYEPSNSSGSVTNHLICCFRTIRNSMRNKVVQFEPFCELFMLRLAPFFPRFRYLVRFPRHHKILRAAGLRWKALDSFVKK